MNARAKITLAVLAVSSSAAGDDGGLHVGTYSLERLPKTAHFIRGLPPCGDDAKHAFSDFPRLTVVYEARPESAVVNDQAWVILTSSAGRFAAKAITSCTSLTLKFHAQGESATGLLVFVSKCPDGKTIQCASPADYKGTFTAR